MVWAAIRALRAASAGLLWLAVAAAASAAYVTAAWEITSSSSSPLRSPALSGAAAAAPLGESPPPVWELAEELGG
jgi:hypothetical protein